MSRGQHHPKVKLWTHFLSGAAIFAWIHTSPDNAEGNSVLMCWSKVPGGSQSLIYWTELYSTIPSLSDRGWYSNLNWAVTTHLHLPGRHTPVPAVSCQDTHKHTYTHTPHREPATRHRSHTYTNMKQVLRHIYRIGKWLSEWSSCLYRSALPRKVILSSVTGSENIKLPERSLCQRRLLYPTDSNCCE